MKILCFIAAAGYILMIISGLVLPANMIAFWVLTIGYMLSAFGMYGFYLIMMISIINTVEYNEYKHGTRDEGIITSLRPFLTKLASALTVVIASGTYLLTGVTRYTNEISTLENAAAAGQITEADKLSAIHELLRGVSHGQSRGLLLVMIVLPYLLMVVSYFLYLRRYKLDEPEYDRICGELRERRAQKKA